MQITARASGSCSRNWQKNKALGFFPIGGNLKDTCQRLISMALLMALLAGCLAGEGPLPSPPWQYADLRVLASPGAGPASHQLVALYTRRLRDQHQIRLDMLDLTTDQNFDLYLAIDSAPAGSTRLPIQAEAGLAWDLLLLIPSSGSLQAYGPDGVVQDGVGLRVVRNSVLDTVVVSFADDSLPGAYRVQAFLTPQDSSEVASSLGPVRSDAWPPPRLPVLLAFWNTFPAYTPAQALRRYDGAHSGPASNRHGLRNLLDAIEAARFPAVLLDLKSPASLSALDFAGGMSQVQDLADRDLLILPDLLPLDMPSKSPYQAPAWVRVRSAQDARQVSRAFGLESSLFLYSKTFPYELEGDLLQLVGNYHLIFSAQSPASELAESITAIAPGDQATPDALPGKPTAELSRRGAYVWVNLAPAGKVLLASTQASSTGPTLEIRRALLEAAVSPQEDQPVVLGGDLAQTAWGNPQSAMQTLRYLSSRPWIQPLTSAELATLSASSANNPVGSSSLSAGLQPQEPFVLHNPAGEPLASGLSAQQVHDLLLQELLSAPENAATQLAWQAYDALMAPAAFSSPVLASLRAAYLGQIGHLLGAAQWGSKPDAFCSPSGASASCLAVVDLDWDGEDEYILSSLNFFGIFEARGGYLALAFVRSPDGLHQIIAPSTQFVVGLGDPLSWEPNRGVAGDSTQLRGAFSDLPLGFASPSWEIYSVEISEGSLTFKSLDGSLRKTFRLVQSGLQADYSSKDPLQVQIPIAVKPEARFAPDWAARYQGQVLQGRYEYGLSDGLRVQVPFPEGTCVEAFSFSLEYMGQAENPDIDYPPGHYTPFPLALVTYKGQGEFSLQLEFNFNIRQ
jgi:hypothetical protein